MKREIYTIALIFSQAFIYGQSYLSGNDDESDKLENQNTVEQTDNIIEKWRARRFTVAVGGFFPSNNTEVRVRERKGNLGTKIDLEDDLGFDRFSYSFIASAQWRISKRSRLDAEYFYLNRNSIYTLEKEIEFGENTYDINAEVDAFFKMGILRFSYGYALIAKPKYEIGALIGAHVIFGQVGINGSGKSANIEASSDFSFTAPLPDIGIWTDIQLSKRLGLFANVNYLALEINNIKGQVFSTNLSLLYNVYENLSLKAGYSSMNFNVQTERKRLEGFFKWGYNGPVLSATYTFGKQIKM